MGKYDELLSQANVLLTDLSLHTFNSDQPHRLRLVHAAKQLRSDVAFLQAENSGRGPLARIKDALYISQQEILRGQAAQRIRDNIEQLSRCVECRCATCVKIADHCDCTGCLYGAKTVSCDDDVVSRDLREGACDVDGLPLLNIETDRARLTHIITVRTPSGSPQRYRFNLRSGEKSVLLDRPN